MIGASRCALRLDGVHLLTPTAPASSAMFLYSCYYYTLHAQPLRCAVRGRNCNLPQSAAISPAEIAPSSREIAGDQNLDFGQRI